MSALPEGALFGMGNPLLDIMATVDKEFLEKYKLKDNDAILADDTHKSMCDEIIKNYEVEFIAGGAAQNALRVMQWIVGKPNVTTFMGSVGDDENGKTLASCAIRDGVNVQYQIQNGTPTGKCAALITGHHRSLCTYLEAANLFTKEHLMQPTNFAYIEKAQFYYVTGFFLTVSAESFQTVAKYAASKNRPFMFNLSAAFISQFYTKEVNDALPYVDIIFGNEVEAEAFSNVQNFGTSDMVEIAKKVAALPKENKARSRIVVFTQGVDPVIVVEGDSVKTFEVKPLPEDKIKDTNGAGDAFVGGFMAQYTQGKPIESCVKCGIWAASVIIQFSGCQFPKDVTYVEA